MTEAGRATLAARLRRQAAYNSAAQSMFYAQLLLHLAEDAERGGPTWDLLHTSVDDAPLHVPHLSLLAAAHAAALSGAAPELAAHYPSTGGDGDADAVWPALRAWLRDHGDTVREWLARNPQTNEVGRAAPLVSALLVVADETGLPLRLLEVGSSAGLNLRLDHFWYEADGHGFGDPASPVRFVDAWEGGVPPFDAPMVVASRLGCDRHPIDPSSERGRILLLAYTWPDQAHRFELLRSALDVAAQVPATVEAADAFDWLPAQLAVPTPGVATVVFHSVVLQYFSPGEVERLGAVITDAARRATAAAPLAWVRLEPPAGRNDPGHVELRVTVWPGGEERQLARASFHVGTVHWLGRLPAAR